MTQERSARGIQGGGERRRGIWEKVLGGGGRERGVKDKAMGLVGKTGEGRKEEEGRGNGERRSVKGTLFQFYKI